MIAWIKSHLSDNRDWYLWPVAFVLVWWACSFAVSKAQGREPLADMAVNLQALNAYALLTFPIFLSLFWASLAAKLAAHLGAWTFRDYESWFAAEWQKQLIDTLTYLVVFLVVFVTCVIHFDRHS